VTQLKWRLQEGLGEAIYEIGVEDNGLLAGLTREDLNMSLDTLKRMAGKLGSETTVLREQVVDGCEGEDSARIVAEVLVRKVSDDQQVST
jgi:GTPase